MADITAFGSIFKAFGCTLNYNSDEVCLEVTSSPKPAITDPAVNDMARFDHTANYADGMSAVIMADTIDGEKNPINKTIRKNVLEGLAITKNGLYVYQALSLLKNNRSWHNSDQPNSCIYFGEVCTHRGINPNPLRKGKRSHRQPTEYHSLDGKGMPQREQLVTPAVEKLFQAIPDKNLISGQRPVSLEINLKALSKMSIEQKLRVISDLQKANRTASRG